MTCLGFEPRAGIYLATSTTESSQHCRIWTPGFKMSEAYMHLVAGPILLCWGFEPRAHASHLSLIYDTGVWWEKEIHIAALTTQLSMLWDNIGWHPWAVHCTKTQHDHLNLGLDMGPSLGTSTWAQGWDLAQYDQTKWLFELSLASNVDDCTSNQFLNSLWCCLHLLPQVQVMVNSISPIEDTQQRFGWERIIVREMGKSVSLRTFKFEHPGPGLSLKMALAGIKC